MKDMFWHCVRLPMNILTIDHHIRQQDYVPYIKWLEVFFCYDFINIIIDEEEDIVLVNYWVWSQLRPFHYQNNFF
jgi:hypothetical protein